MTKTIEQYNRLKRWYNLFQEIDQGRVHDRNSNYYLDTVYAFFQNCYHLKDWIYYDNKDKFTKEDLNNFINDNMELKVCGALCNGSKHLLIEDKHFDEKTKIGSKGIKLALGGGEPHVKIKFEILTSGDTYDAFDLATKCVNLWEDFFRTNKLYE